MTKTAAELTVYDAWNLLLAMGVSEQTLRVVTDINGYCMESMRDILYAFTGYTDFKGLEEE